MKKAKYMRVYSKITLSFFMVALLIAPTQNTNAALMQTSNGLQGTANDYAFTIDNASALFDSVVGCTITTESISSTISKVLVKGQKFGAKTNKNFQEIFNDKLSTPDELDTGSGVDLKTTDSQADAQELTYGWRSPDFLSNTEDFTKFTQSTGIVPGQLVKDTDVDINTSQTVEELKKLNNKANEDLAEAEKKRVREQCLNGVAYTLAKMQLAKITSDTLNWVNTGLGGSPLFVRDQVSYLQNIADQKLLDFLGPISSSKNSTIYPYGRDFARGTLINRSTTFEQKSINTMNRYLPTGNTVGDWGSDFRLGGWNAWLAFTQNPYNNPLGYQLEATSELAKRQNKAQQASINELNQGGGFLSGKECVEWEKISEVDKDGVEINIDPSELADLERELNPGSDYSLSDRLLETGAGARCLRWETTTPGSVIENQVNTTLTSAVRQLELADSLNESLSVLFRNLLTNLMTKGLKGLDQTMREDALTGKGLSSTSNGNNYYDSLGNNISLLPGYEANRDVLTVNQGSGVNTSNFNITTDLGDIYGDVYYEGCTMLDGTPISCLAANNPFNSYFENKIVLDECSDGIDNDSDGLSDGEDPNCAKPNKRVVKKGLIRIQKEYIDAVKKSKAELPNVMPALGELDYCIPGPNPSWKNATMKEVNSNIEFLRSLSIDSNKEINTLYGKMSELDKRFAESNPGSSFALAGQLAPVVGSAFGPVGTGIGAVVGIAFNLVAKDRVEDAKINYYNEQEILKRYVVDKAGEFEKQKRDGITRLIKTFNAYEDDYEKLYGQNSPMRTPPTSFNKNEYYLPMANAGLELTQNMRVYAKNIDKAQNDYDDLVTEANANIYKLEQIKKKVDAIVRRANTRRANDIRTGKLVIAPECYGLVELDLEGITYVKRGAGEDNGNNNGVGGGNSGGGQTGGGGSSTGGGSNPQ